MRISRTGTLYANEEDKPQIERSGWAFDSAHACGVSATSLTPMTQGAAKAKAAPQKI